MLSHQNLVLNGFKGNPFYFAMECLLSNLTRVKIKCVYCMYWQSEETTFTLLDSETRKKVLQNRGQYNSVEKHWTRLKVLEGITTVRSQLQNRDINRISVRLWLCAPHPYLNVLSLLNKTKTQRRMMKDRGDNIC